MASEVDISNIALAHLGDTATVASLNPPEGSAQSEHCARFYPIARDALLEMHPWNFATRRATLSLLSSAWPEWTYCYAMPADCIRILAVAPPDSTDDFTDFVPAPFGFNQVQSFGQYVPQPYCVESLGDGASVIYTDQEDAVLRYTARVTDTTKFSPLFTSTLTHYLASMLAGPLLKGDVGAAEAKRQLAIMNTYLAQAKTSDANQRKIALTHSVPWMTGR